MKCGKIRNGSKPFARSMVFCEQLTMHYNFGTARGMMCFLLMWALLDHSLTGAAAAKLEPSKTTTLRPMRANSEDDMILREDIFELQPEQRRQHGEESLRQSRKFKESRIQTEKKSKDALSIPADEELAVSRISEPTQSRRSKSGGLIKGKLVVEEVNELVEDRSDHLVQRFKKASKINHNHHQLEVDEEDDVELQPLEADERGTINSFAHQDQGKPKKSASIIISTSKKDGSQSKLKKFGVSKKGQPVSGGGKAGRDHEVSVDGDHKHQNRSAKGGQGDSYSRGNVRGGGADDSDDRFLISSAKSSLNVELATATTSKDDAASSDHGNTDDHQVEEEGVVAQEREEDKELIAEYNLGEPIRDWDRQRQEWAAENPEVNRERLFILTGTQPWPCANAEGDHLLLRCFKNKVDYSRIHGVGMFYNTALLDAHMPTFWAKLPVVRATMLAHPEVEWIWWLDADAIITDMEFEVPLQRYAAYNLVVHGWESLIFEKRSWLGLNAGSFLLRNCQWSMDLLERWASMGPKAPMGDAYRHILSDFLPDRPRNPTDDQAALIYLLIKERERWADKLRVELDFFLSGYWLELMDGFEVTEQRYRAMEERHAELVELLQLQGEVGKEKMVREVGRAREKHLSGASVQERRPFITHFTGCQPCSGHHNTIYSKEQCHVGLVRALNYADDQVLRTLGYQHRALHLPDVLPHSFSSSSSSST